MSFTQLILQLYALGQLAVCIDNITNDRDLDEIINNGHETAVH